MDNYIELLIYLLIIVGSGLLQAFKKKKKSKQSPSDSPDTQERPRQRREVSSPQADTTTQEPASFEDILRELMGGEPQTRQRKEPEETYEPYEPYKQYEERQKELSDDTTYSESYQRAVTAAEETEKLDDRIDLENLDDFIKPRTYRPKGRRMSKFAREVKGMLQNSKSARKAVILSEILNRKHF